MSRDPDASGMTVYADVFWENEGFGVIVGRLGETCEALVRFGSFVSAVASAQTKYGKSMGKVSDAGVMDGCGETMTSTWSSVTREMDALAEKLDMFSSRVSADVAGGVEALIETVKHELKATDKAAAKVDKTYGRAVSDVHKRRDAFHKECAGLQSLLESLREASADGAPAKASSDKAIAKLKKKAASAVKAARKAEAKYRAGLIELKAKADQYYREKAYLVNEINRIEMDARTGMRKYTLALFSVLQPMYEYAANHIARAKDAALLVRPARDVTQWAAAAQTGRIRRYEVFEGSHPSRTESEDALADIDAALVADTFSDPLPDVAFLDALNVPPEGSRDLVFDPAVFDSVDVLKTNVASHVKQRKSSRNLELHILKAAEAAATTSPAASPAEPSSPLVPTDSARVTSLPVTPQDVEALTAMLSHNDASLQRELSDVKAILDATDSVPGAGPAPGSVPHPTDLPATSANPVDNADLEMHIQSEMDAILGDLLG